MLILFCVLVSKSNSEIETKKKQTKLLKTKISSCGGLCVIKYVYTVLIVFVAVK